MELRRIGQALVRSRPTAALAQPPQNHLGLLSTRAFSASAARQQQRPTSSNPFARPPDSNIDRSQGQRPQTTHDSLNSLLDDRLDFNNPVGNKRTSRFSSPSAQYENRNTTSYGIPSGSSADELASRYVGAQKSRAAPPTGSTGNSLEDLFGGLGTTGKPLNEPPDPASLPRLGPSVGRSVTVRDNVDLGKALRQMDSILTRNRVKADYFKQRFHERPGLKRKRLASVRWRQRFMKGFQATVARVQYLKGQGW